VQIILWASLGVLYPNVVAGLPFTGIALGSTPSGPLVSHIIIPALLALGLNEAAYAAELVRAGIISVEAGQAEAALSLGMSPALTMRRIVLPQAMRVIVPTFGNETISMLKTTSLIAAIGGIELFGRLEQVYAQTFQIIPLLVVACIWYLFITSLLTIGQAYLERYFGRGFGQQKEAEAAEKRAAKRAARAPHV
jgi:polar amino acid transport system permease protein